MAADADSSAAPAAANNERPFDVVGTYRRLLAEDADLTMPVAAIEVPPSPQSTPHRPTH